MATMTIYHNPRCTKSRETLALIQAAGVAPDVVLYLDQAPSVAELDRIVTLLGVEPPAIVRNKEALYKELGLDTRTLSRQEWLQTLHDHPKLIERPIVVSGDRAVIGRPPENVQALFG